MTDKPDPNAIIAEGVKVAAQQERQRNVILGVILLLVGIAFGVLGILGLTGRMFAEASELIFGMFGLALSSLWVGTIKLARGLR